MREPQLGGSCWGLGALAGRWEVASIGVDHPGKDAALAFAPGVEAAELEPS